MLTKALLDAGSAITQSVATPQVLASWLSGKNYATTSYVDNIEIGGRNYLKNSANFSGLNSNNGSTAPIIKGVENGVN